MDKLFHDICANLVNHASRDSGHLLRAIEQLGVTTI